nr:MAG TPA: hypothetical protein [Caudoviricetes sp.]
MSACCCRKSIRPSSVATRRWSSWRGQRLPVKRQ